jgi:hypothetical protein
MSDKTIKQLKKELKKIQYKIKYYDNFSSDDDSEIDTNSTQLKDIDFNWLWDDYNNYWTWGDYCGYWNNDNGNWMWAYSLRDKKSKIPILPPKPKNKDLQLPYKNFPPKPQNKLPTPPPKPNNKDLQYNNRWIWDDNFSYWTCGNYCGDWEWDCNSCDWGWNYRSLSKNKNKIDTSKNLKNKCKKFVNCKCCDCENFNNCDCECDCECNYRSLSNNKIDTSKNLKNKYKKVANCKCCDCENFNNCDCECNCECDCECNYRSLSNNKIDTSKNLKNKYKKVANCKCCDCENFNNCDCECNCDYENFDKDKSVKKNINFDKYILSFNESVDLDDKIKKLSKKIGFTHKHKYTNTLHGCSATIDKSLMSDLLNDVDIKFIEKDIIASYNVFDKVGLNPEKALLPNWHQTITNTAIVAGDDFSLVHCYILDTGILDTHMEFDIGQVVLDYNAITFTNGISARDDNGHGTGVASMIGGKTVGCANKTVLHSIKVLDSNGSGYVSDIINGLDWVITNKIGPSIINMSLTSNLSMSFNSAVQKCIINGITVVCASGNNSIDGSILSPVSTIGAIAVSAYDSAKTKPTWSDFGPYISTFAPGVSIKSAYGTSPSTYYLVSGTSFSSPIVVGIIVRYLKKNVGATQTQINSYITKSNIANEILNPGTNTINARIVFNNNVSPC